MLGLEAEQVLDPAGAVAVAGPAGVPAGRLGVGPARLEVAGDERLEGFDDADAGRAVPVAGPHEVVARLHRQRGQVGPIDRHPGRGLAAERGDQQHPGAGGAEVAGGHPVEEVDGRSPVGGRRRQDVLQFAGPAQAWGRLGEVRPRRLGHGPVGGVGVRRGGEALAQPLAQLLVAPAGPPRVDERHDQPQRPVRVVGDGVRQRGPHVVVLPVEALEPHELVRAPRLEAHPLGQRRAPVEMGVGRLDQLALVHQPVVPEGAQ